MKIQILSCLALAAGLQAQVFTPPADKGPQPANPPQDVAANPKPQPGPNPLGNEIPLLNPAAESIKVGNIEIPLLDNRLVMGRFERYLSQNAEDYESALKYRKDMNSILGAISPMRQKGPDLEGAFRLLPAASEYPGDANLCMSLAESVYTALLTKQGGRSVERLNESLKAEKDKRIREGDWQAQHDRENRLNNRRPVAGGGQQNQQNANNAGRGVQALKYAETLKRIAEIDVEMKANRLRLEAEKIQAKANYQAIMVQWFMQRRFEHVVMASRFYNQIWRDGDQALHVDGNADLPKILAEGLGVPPTVAMLDSLSNEAIREATKYVEAFENMLDRGELHVASERLLEAFYLGEYLEPLATLDLEKKRKIQDYYRDLSALAGAMQMREYVRAQELVVDLKRRAKDFPAFRFEGIISAHTMASDLAIDKAKSHMLAQENDKATQEIKFATETWPTNPRLQEVRDLMKGLGPLVKIRNDFDRLLSEGNYREIARRQYDIAPAIQGDQERLDAFTQIITNLTKIEAALGKAEEFSRAGQKYAAWEQLALIREQFPDDPKLGRQLELLAPEVADFTRAITMGKEYEERMPQQTGTSLSWYLKARSIHPQSDMARDGVMRLAGIIMPAD